jgi:streptogramin lyase
MRRKNAGLSLLEVVIASLILFFVCILVFSDFISSLRAYSIAKIVTTTLFLNQNLMEKSFYALSPEYPMSKHGSLTGPFASYSYNISNMPQAISQETLISVQVSGPQNVSRTILAAKFLPRFWGVASDSAGNLYFPSQNGSTLEIFSSGSLKQTSPTSAPTTPFFSGVAVDTSGNVWVGDTANQMLWKYNSSNGWQSWLLPGGGIPEGIVVDPAGNLWIADRFNDSILKFSNGLFSTPLSLPNQGIPSGIAYDSTSTTPFLWISDSLNHLILAYSLANQNFSASIPLPNFGEPSGITLDSAGDVWVVDTRNNVFWEYLPSTLSLSKGKWLGPFAPQPDNFSAPRGLALDSLGDLILSDIQSEWKCYWNQTAWNCQIIVNR